nr:MAG TPA: hypothetical protein [Caudoviricetes sp.]
MGRWQVPCQFNRNKAHELKNSQALKVGLINQTVASSFYHSNLF